MGEHRSEFSREEAEQIRELLREVRRADRSRQKVLRARLRRIGFYITDYAHDQAGFTVSDFDDLVQQGVIRVRGRKRGVETKSGQARTRRSSPTPRRRVRRSRGDKARRTAPSRSRRSAGGGGSAWYEKLRVRYRPEHLRILLIAESPPDPGSGDKRFFYAPTLASADNLYRGVAEAVYGQEPNFSVHRKPAVLERLRGDGYWLIDAVEHPVNKISASARKAEIRAAVPALVERCDQLAPSDGVIVCHGVVYGQVAPALRAAEVRVLHDVPLPFPLGNWRRQFVEGFREALARI